MRDFGPKLIPYDATKDVQLNIPVAAGRNDIVIDFVDPTPTEHADDPLVRMAQISKIELRPPGNVNPLPISQ